MATQRDKAQATLLHREVEGHVQPKRLDVISIASTCPHEVSYYQKQSFLWIKMANRVVQAWHNEGVITLGNRAWLHLAENAHKPAIPATIISHSSFESLGPKCD